MIAGRRQGLDPRVAEPQGWGLRPSKGRSRRSAQSWTRKDAALTDMFMIQQSAVDVTGLACSSGRWTTAAKHSEIVGR